MKKSFLILGNVSSGKSSFINSFLKFSILPTSNLVCTTNEIEIFIRNKIKNCKYKNLTKSHKINNQEEFKKLMLENLNHRLRIEMPSTEKILNNKFIYDSPGINNSIDNNHKNIALGILNNYNYKIFVVLNAENMCTTDDLNLFNELKKYKFGLEKQINIIINKIDKILLSDTDTLEELEQNLVFFLKTNKIDNYTIDFYSSIYFELKKNDNLDKKLKRYLNLLDEYIGEKRFNKMKKKILKKFY